jgi:putative inorganic carbon (HCO3(-)) transporter
MPLRLIPAIFLMVIAVVCSLRNSRHGLCLLLLSIFINPGSFFWLIDSFHIPLLLGFSTGIAAIREGKIFGKDRHFPAQGWLFFWLLIFLTLSAVAGEIHSRTFPMLKNWVMLFFMFSLILVVFTEEEQVRNMWFLILGAIGLLAVRGLLHYFQGWDEITGLANSTMEDRNDFAMVLAMSLPFSYYFFRTEKGLLRIGFFILHGLILVVTLLTNSRMGFLLICIYLGILFLQSKRKTVYLIITIPVIILAISIAPKPIVDRMETITKYQEDASAMGRIQAWNVGLAMMIDKPITGVGLDSFERPGIFSRYSNYKPRVAHNAYIQLGAEAGIPALFLYLSIIVTSALKMWRLRSSSDDDTQRLFCNAMLVSLILYCGGAVFLSAEDRESFYVLIASVSAIGLIRESKARGAKKATA